MHKPVVHFVRTPDDIICEGATAWLFNVVDHPSPLVSNTPGTAVQTSPVLKIDGADFETRHTIYRPIPARNINTTCCGNFNECGRRCIQQREYQR